MVLTSVCFGVAFDSHERHLAISKDATLQTKVLDNWLSHLDAGLKFPSWLCLSAQYTEYSST